MVNVTIYSITYMDPMGINNGDFTHEQWKAGSF